MSRFTLLLLSLSPLVGCVNSRTQWVEVTVTTELIAPEGLSAPVYGEWNHTWSGEGELRVPLLPFEDFAAEGPGLVTTTLLVPLDGVEGLTLYAWMDLDGDGLHCAPGVTDEPAGLGEALPFPATEAEVTLSLEAPCLGAEALWDGG